jgi:hypothetical protein
MKFKIQPPYFWYFWFIEKIVQLKVVYSFKNHGHTTFHGPTLTDENFYPPQKSERPLHLNSLSCDIKGWFTLWSRTLSGHGPERTRHTSRQEHSHCRSDLGPDTDTIRMCLTKCPEVQVFTVEAVYGETEKRNETMKIMWMHDILVSRCNEGEFHKLFQSRGLHGSGPGPRTGIGSGSTESRVRAWFKL